MSPAVAFEDEQLLVIDKPQGLAVTPGAGPNLCEIVFQERPALAAVAGHKSGEGGLLNRLDNDTGGLVLFAKDDDGFRHYASEMKAGRVKKTYLAVVNGRPERRDGRIDLPIGHSPKSAKRMLAAAPGRFVRGRAREARTVWRVLEETENGALVEVSIEKGVRHQIRVHLSSLGCPIVGDRLYNRRGGSERAPHHLLYCCGVAFCAPDGREREVRTDVPWRDSWRSFLA